MGLVGKHCTRLATLCLSQCQGLGDDVTFSVRDDSSCAPAALASMRALLGIPRALHVHTGRRSRIYASSACSNVTTSVRCRPLL